jgi:V-type H+-transporting ATPase subunit a
MSQFRSEDMTMVQLFIQSEAAHDTLKCLAELNEGQGCIQFKDENADKSAFQRLFVSDVRRCDDMLRILRAFKELVAKEKKLKGNGEDTTEVSLHELHDKLLEVEKDMKEHGNAFHLLQKQQNDIRVLSSPPLRALVSCIVLDKAWYQAACAHAHACLHACRHTCPRL